MKTPKLLSQRSSSITEEAENGTTPLSEAAMIDFASVLDDFMDEEVLDKQGAVIGTLACYWQSVSGLLVFLGIKVKGQQGVCVVPGRRSQVDRRNTYVWLDFQAEDVESAPHFDCANELDATFERSVYEHFRVAAAKPHGGLRYFARQA
jgi:hypothetical protein